MKYEYSENVLVQDSAAALMHDELGWDVVFAYNQEVLGENGTLGRKDYHEIVLWRYFDKALKKLNPWITDAQIAEAHHTLSSYLSSASLLQINEEKYFMIRDGIPVTVKKPNGKTEEKKAIVIDFNDPDNNHFLAVKELKIHGDLYRRRTDIVGFVNGLPLLFIELKRNDVDVENAYTDNYTDYQDTIPLLFYYNAFLMLSNGMEAKVGTLGSKYEFFHEWKRLSEDDEGSVALETMLRGICKKENFLDLYENFILYDHSDGKTVKILARNHQYLGVNEAVKAYGERQLREGKLGVFWHTQGSGKSYSMLFLSQKIRRKFPGSPTIVVLTDRDELNKQICGTFEACGLLGKTEGKKFMATSGTDLVNKLKGNPSFIFSLIQKFNKPDEPPIYPDHDILIISDEAHRSQYGVFADNIEKLLPTASRIGFTGTPLLSSNEITARTFGGYISVYDFKRAVEDKATVPLYYENRGDKIKEIKNPDITDKILDAIEEADLNPDQAEKVMHEFEKEVHLLTAEPRLRAIAKDFVGHYSDLWTTGKAMFVCLNKVTCVRMYNFVQEYWKEEIKSLEQRIAATSSDQEQLELTRKLKWMKDTEMCVVISQEQNEIQTFKKWDLDILPHRTKMEKRELDKEFKDSDSNFRVVFVCAMWLTGFDVKSLSCLYLDKPLKAHTLMQTIARANRVNEGKSNGLVIDYIGIVKALKKALNDYTQNKDGKTKVDPTVDKEEMIKQISKAIADADQLLSDNDYDLLELIGAEGFRKLQLLADGAEAMCSSPEIKKQYETYSNEISRLVKYLDRKELTENFRKNIDAILAIFREMQKKRRHIDTTDLMVEINHIINENVEIEQAEEGLAESRQFDISQIDFDLLATEFARVRHKNLLIKDLDDLVQIRLEKMLSVNPSRIDYYDRYMQIIEEYNSEQDRSTIEKTFMELMNLAQSMSEEQQRYVREGFSSDEELSIYDLLFSENLSKSDIEKIKKVSVDLLSKIKERIAGMDHWTDKQETRAAVEVLIRDVLFEEIPDSMFNRLEAYRKAIFEHIYTHYKGVA
ncbi:type I restriction endonuclease subunit R [Pseudobutyrivibrio xylanivorans]|uniref:Type I restriction enzyme endonuclease subunit n=1 Tax=Pseudobutyrivibrio xylanivorans TaxID=185007 RepID=A0A1G5RTG2_PSEXY|nr:type I restriction endonuclease subunit R [Pseudobutyrivibrio xylanivorans]SCZ77402.1 type I restriction enzyme, R subunit [Pseudobutyrivibrio xylanivorans]